MSAPRSNDVMLLGEFARLAGISRMTAYIWARAGDIPATFRGGRHELVRADVPAIIKQLRKESRPLSRQKPKS